MLMCSIGPTEYLASTVRSMSSSTWDCSFTKDLQWFPRRCLMLVQLHWTHTSRDHMSHTTRKLPHHLFANVLVLADCLTFSCSFQPSICRTIWDFSRLTNISKLENTPLWHHFIPLDSENGTEHPTTLCLARLFHLLPWLFSTGASASRV